MKLYPFHISYKVNIEIYEQDAKQGPKIINNLQKIKNSHHSLRFSAFVFMMAADTLKFRVRTYRIERGSADIFSRSDRGGSNGRNGVFCPVSSSLRRNLSLLRPPAAEPRRGRRCDEPGIFEDGQQL